MEPGPPPAEEVRVEVITPSPIVSTPVEQIETQSELATEAVKVEGITPEPMLTVPVEKTEAESPSPSSAPAERPANAPKTPARWLDWPALTGCLPWLKRKKDAEVARPDVPVPLKRLTLPLASQVLPASDSAPAVVENLETPPGMETTPEAVALLSIETP